MGEQVVWWRRVGWYLGLGLPPVDDPAPPVVRAVADLVKAVPSFVLWLIVGLPLVAAIVVGGVLGGALGAFVVGPLLGRRYGPIVALTGEGE